MRKSMIALAILSATSAPAVAQSAAPTTVPQASAQSDAKPQTVKKRVCYQAEEDSYSRLGGRKVCKMVEVPATPAGGGQAGQASAPSAPGGNNL
jgi:hypothetical protein